MLAVLALAQESRLSMRGRSNKCKGQAYGYYDKTGRVKIGTYWEMSLETELVVDYYRASPVLSTKICCNAHQRYWIDREEIEDIRKFCEGIWKKPRQTE